MDQWHCDKCGKFLIEANEYMYCLYCNIYTLNQQRKKSPTILEDPIRKGKHFMCPGCNLRIFKEKHYYRCVFCGSAFIIVKKSNQQGKGGKVKTKIKRGIKNKILSLKTFCPNCELKANLQIPLFDNEHGIFWCFRCGYYYNKKELLNK